MSGTTAQDGFIFQADIAVCLTVEKIESGQRIKRIRLEVRKPDTTDLRKNEYVVDIIIECEDSPNGISHIVELFEVKSGDIISADLSNIAGNLTTCATALYPSAAAAEFPKRLVTRYPVSDQVRDECNQHGLELVIMEDRIERENANFSSLERRIRDAIEAILIKCMPTDMPSNLRSRILFSLGHLFRHEIKRLAQKLKENPSPSALETVDITLEKILNHDESFADLVAITKGLGSRRDGYEAFCSVVFETGVLPSPSMPPPEPSSEPPSDIESSNEALVNTGAGGRRDGGDGDE